MRKNSLRHPLAFFTPVFFLLLATGPGCGLLIGNIKPVDEKSDHYGVAELDKENPKVWTKLTPAQEGADSHDPETTTTEVPDVAFQSSRTAAVVSINSSCRPTTDTEAAQSDLRVLANQLTYGITDISHRTERNLTVQSLPALETALQGRMNGNEISLKAVVLKKNACIYDLLYMAPPAHFADNEPDFDHFVASLRLK
jgi:hypothetical protein